MDRLELPQGPLGDLGPHFGNHWSQKPGWCLHGWWPVCVIFTFFTIVIWVIFSETWKEDFMKSAPAVALMVCRFRAMTPAVSHNCSVYSVGILLFLNCRIIFMSRRKEKKKKLSTYSHFLFFQPVWVVIMEHCGVADNCLVLSSRSARSGYKLFPLLPKGSSSSLWPQDRAKHGPCSSLWSARVISVNQSLTSGSFQSKVQTKQS